MGSDYTISYGTHATPDDGRCAMEWVSYLAGERHSDEPACVSPVLRVFCTSLNDGLDDSTRQRLRPYLTRTIGTADDGLDDARAWMAMDWLIRTYTPAWLAPADLTDAAQRLRSLPEVTTVEDLTAALEELSFARLRARGAWAGGRAAAWVAPWAAARFVARETAWATAAAAAWAAARARVGDIAGDRARAAARAAAGDAAGAMARAAGRRTTRAAAKDAARAALAPTLTQLQESAFALLNRMLPTVPLAPPAADDAEQVCSLA
jgi:hypothetical protein